MPDLLTTDEAAAYLRLSERKLYELVANGAVPCTKVTGKWLFPRAELDRWLVAGLIAPAGVAHAPAPPIVGGSHDPLLEWALRESGSRPREPAGRQRGGLAAAGARRSDRGGIHLHRSTATTTNANIERSRARRACTTRWSSASPGASRDCRGRAGNPLG